MGIRFMDWDFYPFPASVEVMTDSGLRRRAFGLSAIWDVIVCVFEQMEKAV